MKRIMTLCLLLAMLVGGASAQKGMQQIGGDLGFAVPYSFLKQCEYLTLGIGVNYQYHLTDNISIEPEFRYYFSNIYSDVSGHDYGYKMKVDWSCSVSGLYHIGMPKVCRPYIKVGIGLEKSTELLIYNDSEERESNLGPLLGLGLDVRLAYHCSLKTEIQGIYLTYYERRRNSFKLNLGLTYNF